jgi:hypothetical protein
VDNIEKWVPAFNAEPYEVSDWGRIRRGGRLLKPWVNSRGYLVIDVRGRVKVRIHRLVYQSFRGDTGVLVIDHIDHDKTNNHLINLQAITQAENVERAKQAGRCVGYTGPPTRRPMTDDHRREIFSLYADGRSKQHISNITGRSRSVIDRALKAVP